jgi:hypothetical protein
MDKKAIEIDAQVLRDAMKGSGTSEADIIRITTNHTKKERQALKLAYKTAFGRDLIQDLSKELSGHFKDTILALYDTPAEFDAKCLYKALKGVGTDEDVLTEIICTRSSILLNEVKEKYKELYQEDIVTKIQKETSGHYKKFLTSLLQCNRSENPHPDEEQMKSEAHQLYTAGEGKLGTDEEFFNKIFACRSPAEIYSINAWYTKLSNKSLRASIEKEFSGHIKKALLAVLDGILCPSEYFALKVNKAVKGVGTNNSLLIRTLVSREEIDIPEMKVHYKAKVGKEMVEDIIDDTSGDYKRTLVAICRK